MSLRIPEVPAAVPPLTTKWLTGRTLLALIDEHGLVELPWEGERVRDGRRIGREWQALSLIAEHGVLDTAQIAVLLGVSRPTAHRLLDGLAAAELLDRWRALQGRGHRWFYMLSWSGRRAVTDGRRRAGQPLLRELSQRPGLVTEQHLINEFFVDLVRQAANSGGRAGLVTWRHRVDAQRWLAEQGAGGDCEGSGIWIEDGVSVRFVLLWLTGWQLDAIHLDRLDQDWPGVDVILVVTMHLASEHAVLEHAIDHVRRRLACTTLPLLAAEGPAGAVWAVGSDHGRRLRLAELVLSGHPR